MPNQVQPRVVIADDFTLQRVYKLLAAKLDEAGADDCTLCHVDRYSTGDGGIASQVGRSTRLHSADPDVQRYLAIPNGDFDPGRPDLGRQHGVVHLYLTDIHPSVVQDEYVGAIVKCGTTLFLRLSTSSTQRQVKRYDMADSNAFTLLMVALLNHTAANLTHLRFGDDTRRAGRETPNWQDITSRAAELGKFLTFGPKTYDPQSEHLLLSLLGGMNHQDSVTRIKSLTGGRVEKLLTSTCPVSEGQLPHGIRHLRHKDGRVVLGDRKTKYAEADLAWQPAIVEALRMHAAGADYVDIGLEVLVKHRVPRRGQKRAPGSTYAELADRRDLLSDATKTFFVNGNRTKVGEEHLYLAKLTLWETGRYPYRLANDLKQRGTAVGGLVPQYTGPDDVTGYFDLELDWQAPLIGFRDEVERAEVIRKCRERILRERRQPRTVPGRDSDAGDVRALAGPYERWRATDPADERWPGDTTMYGVTTRTHNSGKNTFILVHYPLSCGVNASGRPCGLMRFANRPGQHVAATWASDAYCASVDAAIQRLVEDRILDPAAVAPVIATLSTAADRGQDRKRSQLEAQRDSATGKERELRQEADGFDRLAARKEAAGDSDAADKYEEKAKRAAAEAEKQREVARRYEDKLQRLTAEGPAPAEPVEANLTLVAYLQAGLHRASLNNGRSSPAFQVAVSEHIVDRRFRVSGDLVEWTATLVVPCIDGQHLRIPLAGSVQNIRVREGKELARADLVAEYVLRDGRDLDDVARQQTAARKTVVMKRLMPWLRDHGITSRGAKNAIVDHPFRVTQRIVYDQVTDAACEYSRRWQPAFVQRLLRTYCDPDLDWGDAACPDDTTWIAEALKILTADTDRRKYGIRVLDLALALNKTEDEIRELVKPQKRSGGGFTRPRYLAYADKAKTHVKAIGCPHSSCKGRRHADHVVLLPEVAASGYGVLCRHCRRTPADHDAWPKTQFPEEYLEQVTNRGVSGGLRLGSQTCMVSRSPE